MDVKHKSVFGLLKIPGGEVKQYQGDGIALTLHNILRDLASTTIHRFNQSIIIEISPFPIQRMSKTAEDWSQHNEFGIDPSLIIPHDQLPPEILERQKRVTEAQDSDPLLANYNRLSIKAFRDSLTPAELQELRRHVETHYAGTDLWDGIHKY